jgi:DNA-binding IclR family transcriptional regulator
VLVLDVLRERGERGATSSEVASRTRLDQNTASARLATLKGTGEVIRTSTKRRGRSVYVLAEHVERETSTVRRREHVPTSTVRRRTLDNVERDRLVRALDDVRLALDYARVALDGLLDDSTGADS